MKATTSGNKLVVGKTELYITENSSILSPGGRALFKAASKIEDNTMFDMNKELKVGQSYTFLQLSKMEDLSDSPGLDVTINGRIHPIQTSHVSDELLIRNCPEFADTLWEYRGMTEEWIIDFAYKGNIPIEQIVDWEPDNDPYIENKNSLWVTPKGSPKKQYYDKDGKSPYER